MTVIQTELESPEVDVADVAPRRGMSRAELKRIVLEAAEHAPAASNNTHAPMQLVEVEGQRYKVRCYANREEALMTLDLMDKAPDLFVPCCGRVGRFVVLTYVSGQPLGDGPQAFRQVARFLASLAQVETEPVSSQAFGQLCSDLSRGRVFRPRTLRMLQRYYDDQLSRPIRWCLQFYDAQPANFIMTAGGNCISIDEKHLLPAPCGFSLIRPLRKFAAEDYEQLKMDYCALVQNDDFQTESYRDFVFFFYSVSVLALYARCTPQKSLPQRAVMLRLRQRAMRVAGVGLPTRLLEQWRWVIPYGKGRLMSFARRAVRFVTSRGRRVCSWPLMNHCHHESNCKPL